MEAISVDWAQIKQFVDDREVSIQFMELGDRYFLKAFDGLFAVDSLINKTEPRNADQIDFEDNYKINGNKKLEDVDDAGRRVTRFAATRKGWHYQVHAISFEIGVKDSLYNKDDSGVDLGLTQMKFYDVNGVDITDTTQINIDANARKTIVTWTPGYDFEVISGSIRQISKKNTDMFMYINAHVATNLPAPYDWVKVRFIEGGINLNYIGADELLKTDGKAAKELRGSNGDYFEIVVNHEVLEKHKVSLLFEIYKDPLS